MRKMWKRDSTHPKSFKPFSLTPFMLKRLGRSVDYFRDKQEEETIGQPLCCCLILRKLKRSIFGGLKFIDRVAKGFSVIKVRTAKKI